MNKTREGLNGKKTCVTAAIGLPGAVFTLADGQIDTVALPAAAWSAAQTVLIRAGMATEVQKIARE